jgi:hypothetical protein
MKTTKTETPEIDLSKDLRELQKRYPKLAIDDLRPGAKEGHGHKRIVTVTCACGGTVVRATSDLFSWKGCPACKNGKPEPKKAKKKSKVNKK